ncbi:MAG: Uma2 family endonuclease [Bacteroidota bacterium]
MKAYKLPKLSIKEYLQQEVDNDTRYEYHDGKIYASAGGSINHGLLCGNIYSELRNGLKHKGSNCKPVTSELKLYIRSQNSFVYPDAMVVCGEIEESAYEVNALTNPILIVEVLSKSTSDYDRGDKFYLYRQIKTLREYVLIEQDKAVVEVYYRDSVSGLWRISRFIGMTATVELQSINLSIKMADLYFDIKNLEE